MLCTPRPQWLLGAVCLLTTSSRPHVNLHWASSVREQNNKKDDGIKDKKNDSVKRNLREMWMILVVCVELSRKW